MDGTSFLKCYKKTKVLSYRSHDPAQSRWQSEVKVGSRVPRVQDLSSSKVRNGGKVKKSRQRHKVKQLRVASLVLLGLENVFCIFARFNWHVHLKFEAVKTNTVCLLISVLSNEIKNLKMSKFSHC